MNVKSIIGGSLAIGLVIGGTLIKKNSGESESVYTPRVVKESREERSARGHAEYMHMLRADPTTGQIDPNLVVQARNEVEARSKSASNKTLNLNWTQMGPDNVGGRCRAIHVDRFNNNIVYAGGVNGGLYVSNDASGNWSRVAGHIGVLGDNLGVTCITQTDNGRIFFGTGTTFEFSSGNGSSGHVGNGVYEYVPSTGQVLPVLVHDATPPNITSGSVSAINAIAARGNRLYLGTRDGMVWADPDGSGNYPSVFGQWTNPIEVVPGLPEAGTVNDIDLGTDGSMVVAFGNKIYLSNSDQLGTFTVVNTAGALPALGGASRLAVAVAKTDPNWIYVIGSTSSGVMTDLCISTDKGQNWDIIVPGGAASVDPLRRDANATSGQGTYDLAIECNPADRGDILVGGIRVFRWNYNAGSNPIGGSWLLAATIFGGSPFNSLYIHADCHTFHWPSAGTIYVGSDGGVNRSIDNGATWQQRNLGFNTTTFYGMAVAANGWFIGGSQDNGNQLFSYGAFGENTPLGTTEVSNSDPNIIFGDGFDVAMSNIAGVAYATAQNSAVVRAAGGAGVSFYDAELLAEYQDGGEPFNTVIKLWESPYDLMSLDSVKLQADTSNGILINTLDTAYAGDTIFAGDTIRYFSLTNGIPQDYIVPSQIILGSPIDSVMVQDVIQSRFVLRMSSGVYMTKDATRLNASSIQWHKISNTSSAENFEFSNDGNHLFIGTSGGSVVRISGLAMYNDSLSLDNRSGSFALTQTTIATGLGGLVSLAIDPNNSDNMIAVSGGYNTSGHVYRCTNATTANTSSGNFTLIQGSGGTSLPQMPVYDAVIDHLDPDKVILGTEWGVWATDNAFSEATPVLVDWYDESAGAAHVPVHEIVQQSIWSDGAVNTGALYLGTHAQGFYMSTDLVTSINDPSEEWTFEDDQNFVTNLSVYPNPISDQGMLEFDLKNSSNAVVKIFSLTGKLVQTLNLGMLQEGNHKERLNVSQLSIGSYIVSLEAGNESTVAKFIVTR